MKSTAYPNELTITLTANEADALRALLYIAVNRNDGAGLSENEKQTALEIRRSIGNHSERLYYKPDTQDEIRNAYTKTIDALEKAETRLMNHIHRAEGQNAQEHAQKAHGKIRDAKKELSMSHAWDKRNK